MLEKCLILTLCRCVFLFSSENAAEEELWRKNTDHKNTGEFVFYSRILSYIKNRVVIKESLCAHTVRPDQGVRYSSAKVARWLGPVCPVASTLMSVQLHTGTASGPSVCSHALLAAEPRRRRLKI